MKDSQALAVLITADDKPLKIKDDSPKRNKRVMPDRSI